MRDELDARIWNRHHQQFSEAVDVGLRASAREVKRAMKRLPKSVGQGLVMAAALAASITTLTLASAAPALAALGNITGAAPTA